VRLRDLDQRRRVVGHGAHAFVPLAEEHVGAGGGVERDATRALRQQAASVLHVGGDEHDSAGARALFVALELERERAFEHVEHFAPRVLVRRRAAVLGRRDIEQFVAGEVVGGDERLDAVSEGVKRVARCCWRVVRARQRVRAHSVDRMGAPRRRG
jgi:hypothetical protein